MTRNFRDAWEASTSGDDESVASPEVQDRVSAMLREHASRDVPAMPSDVEARIRGALAAEFSPGRVLEREPRPVEEAPVSNAVPLPARSARDAAARSADLDETRPTYPDHVERHDASVAAGDSTAGAASPRGAREEATAASRGASVASLDAHRRRRSGPGRVALALGAAAAVAIGTVTAVKLNDSSEPPTAASVSSAAPSAQGGANYASRVRVTQTATKYTSAGLATQAASLRTSKAPPVEPVQANAQSLGPLATGSGVQTCLDAVAKGLISAPDKVYADFATYDGTPAVIVVVVKGKTTTAWVVSRTCSTANDVEAGPTTIHT